MQYEVKELDSIRRQLSVTVAADELQQIENQVTKQFQRQASIPGFRPGRVPVGIVKRRFAEQIKSEVLEKALSRFYYDALKESGLNPISRGEIKDIKFEAIENGLAFDLEIEVEPVIEVKKFKGLKVEKEVINVTEEMIEQALEDVRKQFAVAREGEVVEQGSQISIDAQLLGDGDMPMIGKKMEDLKFEVGSGEFDKDLEEQLLGLKAGEDAVIRKTIYPPDTDKLQPPKIESYRATVKSIEERELPELDDELAKSLGWEGIETVDQLKVKIEEELSSRIDSQGKQLLHNRLIDEFLKVNPFDVPESMVRNYLSHVVEDMKKRAAQQGNKAKIDENAVHQQYRPDAIHSIRWHMLRQRLIEEHKLSVSDDELRDHLKVLQVPEENVEEFMKNPNIKDQVSERLLQEKVIGLLEANAAITEIFPQDSETSGKPAASKKKAPAKEPGGSSKTRSAAKTKSSKESTGTAKTKAAASSKKKSATRKKSETDDDK